MANPKEAPTDTLSEDYKLWMEAQPFIFDGVYIPFNLVNNASTSALKYYADMIEFINGWNEMINEQMAIVNTLYATEDEESTDRGNYEKQNTTYRMHIDTRGEWITLLKTLGTELNNLQNNYELMANDLFESGHKLREFIVSKGFA